MEIANKLVADLIPYANNARTHSDEQVLQIAASIKEFGFTNPILLDGDNGIIAGHGRVMAAKKLGMEEVPTIELTHLSEAQKKAYILADNKLALNAGWDDALLAIEFEELKEMDFDIELTGFDLDEIDAMIPEEIPPGLTDEDQVPEIPEQPVTKLGDVWLCGKHRVMCGDSTSIDAVEKLMDGKKADMVFTDPPYNIASDSKNFAADVSKSMNDLKNSEWDKGFSVKDSVTSIMTICADNVTIYVWTSHFLISDLWKCFEGWADYTSYLVWSKPNPMPSLSKRHPTWNTELCVYASKGSKRVVNFPEGSHFLSCREVVKKSDGSHPTQKPVELIEPIVLFSSNKDQIITDLFGGSGSTLIACEKTNRINYSMEIDEKYCDVIVKRWQDFTGKLATLESTGELFNDLAGQQ
jgi:DNA modification methylase